MIEDVLQVTTTTATTTASSWQPDISSVVLGMAGLASLLTIIYTALKIGEHLTRQRVKVELLQAVQVDPTDLHVIFRIRKKGSGSTSFIRAYHEYGAWGRFFYRLFDGYSHQELVLREVDAKKFYDMLGPRGRKELESMGTPVTLPLRIEGGDTRIFHAFLERKAPKDKHHLVVFTTHKVYVKRLWSQLFREGSRAAILGVFYE